MKVLTGARVRYGLYIYILPKSHDVIEKTGRFVLTNQFEIMTRQRVVNIYVSK